MKIKEIKVFAIYKPDGIYYQIKELAFFSLLWIDSIYPKTKCVKTVRENLTALKKVSICIIDESVLNEI